jgi:hypothetical protein
MLIFVIFILCGFFYIWKMGVLDWSADALPGASDQRASNQRASNESLK